MNKTNERVFNIVEATFNKSQKCGILELQEAAILYKTLDELKNLLLEEKKPVQPQPQVDTNQLQQQDKLINKLKEELQDQKYVIQDLQTSKEILKERHQQLVCEKRELEQKIPRSIFVLEVDECKEDC